MALEVFLQPTLTIETVLTSFLLQVRDTHQNPRIVQFATYCHDRFSMLVLKPHAPILPSTSTLLQAKEAPFLKSVFRSSLQQMMENQKDRFPDLQVPIVLKTLVELVIASGGLTAIGIFRVAAQANEITELRRQLEDSHGEFVPNVIDPHVPACLLKLWLSELRFPVIPVEFYQEVTTNCRDWQKLELTIQKFPPENKNTLTFLVNFLQRIAQEENKMDIKNLAIVISPTLCRCPCSDPLLAMKQTIIESEVIVCLLSNMSTSHNPVFLKNVK